MSSTRIIASTRSNRDRRDEASGVVEFRLADSAKMSAVKIARQIDATGQTAVDRLVAAGEIVHVAEVGGRVAGGHGVTVVYGGTQRRREVSAD